MMYLHCPCSLLGPKQVQEMFGIRRTASWLPEFWSDTSVSWSAFSSHDVRVMNESIDESMNINENLALLLLIFALPLLQRYSS